MWVLTTYRDQRSQANLFCFENEGRLPKKGSVTFSAIIADLDRRVRDFDGLTGLEPKDIALLLFPLKKRADRLLR